MVIFGKWGYTAQSCRSGWVSVKLAKNFSRSTSNGPVVSAKHSSSCSWPCTCWGSWTSTHLGSSLVWEVLSCLDCLGANYKKGWPAPEIYKMAQLDQQDSTCYMHLQLPTCRAKKNDFFGFPWISMDFWGKKLYEIVNYGGDPFWD